MVENQEVLTPVRNDTSKIPNECLELPWRCRTRIGVEPFVSQFYQPCQVEVWLNNCYRFVTPSKSCATQTINNATNLKHAILFENGLSSCKLLYPIVMDWLNLLLVNFYIFLKNLVLLFDVKFGLFIKSGLKNRFYAGNN